MGYHRYGASPAEIEGGLRENLAKHEKFLKERPETNPSREECSKKLYGLATKIFERAKQLKESGKLDGSTAKYDEDEEGIVFEYHGKEPATTINRIIRYLTKENRGHLSTWEGLPSGLNHNILEMNFWTGKAPTSNGSSQGTNAEGPFQEDIMTDEKLLQAIPKVIEQFEEALRQLEAIKE